MTATVVLLDAPVAAADREDLLTIESATETRPLGWAALGAEADRSDGCLLGLRLDDGRLHGFASARLLVGTAHVLRLAVLSPLRRRGHGRSLLAALIPWADAAGADEVTLEVRAGNAAARTLYAGTGFTEVGRRRGYYPDGEDAVVMTRPRTTAVR